MAPSNPPVSYLDAAIVNCISTHKENTVYEATVKVY